MGLALIVDADLLIAGIAHTHDFTAYGDAVCATRGTDDETAESAVVVATEKTERSEAAHAGGHHGLREPEWRVERRARKLRLWTCCQDSVKAAEPVVFVSRGKRLKEQ